MGTKINKGKNKVLIVLFLLGILFLSWFYYNKNFVNTDKNTQQKQFNIYESSFLKFKINIPDRYTTEEKFNQITLTSPNEKILINKISTNFITLDEYIADLKQKNNLNIISQKKLIIDGKEAIEIIVKSEAQTEKDIMVYPDEWTVYTFSTSSEELYSDLDQIARSFKHIP